MKNTETQTSAVSAEDAAAIRAILDRQGDAWNQHDMDAFVADTMHDIDWINVAGMHSKGRDTVRRAHAVLHTGMFAHSRLPPWRWDSTEDCGERHMRMVWRLVRLELSQYSGWQLTLVLPRLWYTRATHSTEIKTFAKFSRCLAEP